MRKRPPATQWTTTAPDSAEAETRSRGLGRPVLLEDVRRRMGEAQAVEAPIEVGTTVAVLARHYGFHSLNPCRISYTIEEDEGGLVRRGFAYGTLPGHGERGEESFTVEWHHEDDSVFYELYAFSRPNHLLAWLGYPLARRLQRRFARDSLQANDPSHQSRCPTLIPET